jgi:hypothetical protein
MGEWREEEGRSRAWGGLCSTGFALVCSEANLHVGLQDETALRARIGTGEGRRPRSTSIGMGAQLCGGLARNGGTGPHEEGGEAGVNEGGDGEGRGGDGAKGEEGKEQRAKRGSDGRCSDTRS